MTSQAALPADGHPFNRKGVEPAPNLGSVLFFEKFEVEGGAKNASIQAVRRYYHQREKKDWEPSPPKSGSLWPWFKGWFWARWKTYRAE